eukprot:4860183-Lingulodinium_polyedra.AAC.1
MFPQPARTGAIRGHCKTDADCGGGAARATREGQDFDRHARSPGLGDPRGGVPQHGVNEGETPLPTAG